MSWQNWVSQSPPAWHGLPGAAGAQTLLTQLLLQQSVLVVHAGGAPVPPGRLTHPHVPLLQNWLVQSPPLPHVPPTLLFWHVPPEQVPLVQSELEEHVPPADTAPQTGLDGLVTSSQNWLQQSPPPEQEVPTAPHATVVLVELLELDELLLVEVVPLTQTVAVVNEDAGGQPEPHA